VAIRIYMGFIVVHYPYVVYGFGVPKNLFVRGILHYLVPIANSLLSLVVPTANTVNLPLTYQIVEQFVHSFSSVKYCTLWLQKL